MNDLIKQMKWQLLIFHKNKVISISVLVTFFYGCIFYFFQNFQHHDKLLITILLNDSAIIGFLFMGLAIIMEKKTQVLAAVLVTPINHHHYLLAKTLVIALLGTLCTLVLAWMALGTSFNVFQLVYGAMAISTLTALFGAILTTKTFEFLKFCLYAAPIIILFVNLPFLDYLTVIDLAWFKYLMPIHPGLYLIIDATENQSSGSAVTLWLAYIMSTLWVVLLYRLTYRLFKSKVIHV